MEIEEHPPGQGMPARLPALPCANVAFTPLRMVKEYGVNVEHVGRLVVKPAISM